MLTKTENIYLRSLKSTLSKTRIMHVITGLNQGGAEGMLTRLVEGLDPDLFDHCVVSLTGQESFYSASIKKQGSSVINLRIRGVFSLLGAIFRLRRLIIEYRPCVVQTWLYHADLFGLLAKFFLGVRPLVWSVRCSALDVSDAPWSTHLLIRLLSTCSSMPEAILFNSRAGLESHHRIGYRPKSNMVIPNGFDTQKWIADPLRRVNFRKQIGIKDDAFLVGMVARFHSVKDFRCFLSAAERIHLQHPQARFVLVGQGVDSDNLELVEDVEAYGLRDCVTLLGSRLDLVDVMSGLDCHVLTSKSEGFPNVLGEAMAVGVPCVSTNAGDSSLILGDVGIVVPVGDADGVANGVMAIIELEPERKTDLSIRSRRRVVENYEMTDVLMRYAEFYKDLNGQSKTKF